MKQKLRVILMLFFAASFFASCSKSVPKQTQYIPKDAIFVMGMDLKNLGEKAAQAHVNWDSLLQANMKDGVDTGFAGVKRKWNEFRFSGVDTLSHLFLFAKMGGSIMSGQSSSFGFVAGISDATKFETFIKNQFPAGGVKKENNYSWANIDEYAVGWNSEVVILSAVTSNDYSDSASTNKARLTQQQLTTLFAQKESDAITSISQFNELMEEKSDMTFWTNSSSVLSTVAFLGMTKFGDLLKESYTAGTLNFENGKASLNYKSYYGKELSEMLKKYPGSKVDMDMVIKYPSQVEGFVSFSFNPQLLIEIIKYSGFDGMANQYMSEMGFGLDDIAKAFKGDFAIVFSDITEVEKPNPYYPEMKMKEPTVKLVFNAAIGDKATYDKIVSKLADKGIMVKKGNQYVPTGLGSEGSFWGTTDKNLVVATDSSLLNQYLSGNAGKANLPADIAKMSNDKAAVFYFDINKILQAFTPEPSQVEAMNNAKATFKDAYLTMDIYDGKMSKGNMELRTMNDKENSLATLIKFIVSQTNNIKAAGQSLNGGGMVDMGEMNTPSVDTTALPEPAK